MDAILNNVKAVSFDLDDTLWDCAPAIVQAERACYDWLSEHAPRVTSALDADALLHNRGRILESAPELAGDVTQLRKRMLLETLTEFGYPSDMADDAFRVFYKARSEVVLYTGCHELLSGLAERYHVAAITNGNADLELIGIDHYFDVIHKATLDSPAKPHPHMFELCLSRFNIQPSELLHVGDNPQTDVAAAQAIGIPAVWYNGQQFDWPDEQCQAEIEVNSLSELHKLLLD